MQLIANVILPFFYFFAKKVMQKRLRNCFSCMKKSLSAFIIQKGSRENKVNGIEVTSRFMQHKTENKLQKMFVMGFVKG